MATAAAVWVDVLPSMRSFGPQLSKQTSTAAGAAGDKAGKGFGRRFSSNALGPIKAMAATAGAVFAGAKVAGFFKDAVAGASDLNETTSKVSQIFGPADKAIQAFAASASTALGQTRQQALDANATFGVFGKSAGLSGKDLSGFTTQLTTLATDMASFNNTSPEQAIQAIGAALRGESEPIRSYGVLLDDASMRQQALKMGLIATTKEALTPQQKVLAAQALILKQTGDQQGDFARTSGGLANQQRILAARFADFRTSLGEMFLPVATKVFTFLAGPGVNALRGVTDFITGRVVPGVKGLIDLFARGDISGGLLRALRVEEDAPIIDTLWSIRENAVAVFERVRAAFAAVSGFVRRNTDALKILGGVLIAGFLLYKTYTAAVAAHAIVTRGITAVTRVWTAVTKAQTVAQLAQNVAMRLNPIGLVVTGLVALGAALVVAYKKSETFRGIVQKAWAGIKAGASAAWALIQPVLKAFGVVLREVGSWALRMWTNYVRPAFGLIGALITTVWANVVRPVFGFFVAYLRTLGKTVLWLWRNVAAPAFKTIGTIISVMWNSFVRPIFGMWMALTRVLGGVIGWLWTYGVKPRLQAIGDRFTWLWRTIIRPAFTGISALIRVAWETRIKPVFEKLKAGLGALARAFSVTRDAIGRAWDGLKEKAAAPIRYVIDTVYNNGIRRVWNAVIDKFDGVALPPLTFAGAGGGRAAPRRTHGRGMQAFARGGRARPGWALVGEEGPELVDFATPARVYTAEQTAGMLQGMGGPLDWARSAGRTVTDSAQWAVDRARDLGEVALGGLRNAADYLLKPVRALIARMGGSGWATSLRGLPNQAIDNMLSFLGRKDQDVPSGSGAGPVVGRDGWVFPLPRGAYSVGVPIHGYPGHTGQDFPAATGTPVYAPFPGYFNPVNLGNRSYGRYIDLRAGAMRFIGAHLSAFTRGAGMVAAGEMLGRVGSTGRSTGPHLHAEFRDNGAVTDPRRLLTFDQGGKLPPGLNLTYNGTGGPEMVFNQRQWATLNKTAAAAPPHIQVYLGTEQITDLVRVVVDGRDAALTDSLTYRGA